MKYYINILIFLYICHNNVILILEILRRGYLDRDSLPEIFCRTTNNYYMLTNLHTYRHLYNIIIIQTRENGTI